MEQLGWSYQELMDCPYESYLDYRRIMSIEAREKSKAKKRQEQQARRQQ